MIVEEVLPKIQPFEKDKWVNMYNVKWFDGDQLKYGTFAEELLKLF